VGDEIQEPKTGWGRSRASITNRPLLCTFLVGRRPSCDRDCGPLSSSQAENKRIQGRLPARSKAVAARRSCFFGLPQIQLKRVDVAAPRCAEDLYQRRPCERLLWPKLQIIARAEMRDTLLASPGIESGGSITIMTWANETGLVAGCECLLNEARPVFSTRVSILRAPRITTLRPFIMHAGTFNYLKSR
jgi:hypothetical protein